MCDAVAHGAGAHYSYTLHFHKSAPGKLQSLPLNRLPGGQRREHALVLYESDLRTYLLFFASFAAFLCEPCDLGFFFLLATQNLTSQSSQRNAAKDAEKPRSRANTPAEEKLLANRNQRRSYRKKVLRT